MNTGLGVILIILGLLFAANAVRSVTGRYSGERALPGRLPPWANVVLAATVFATAFVGAFILLR
jgi:hypothetical protein